MGEVGTSQTSVKESRQQNAIIQCLGFELLSWDKIQRNLCKWKRHGDRMQYQGFWGLLESRQMLWWFKRLWSVWGGSQIWQSLSLKLNVLKLQSNKSQTNARTYFPFLRVSASWRGIRILSHFQALQRHLLLSVEANIYHINVTSNDYCPRHLFGWSNESGLGSLWRCLAPLTAGGSNWWIKVTLSPTAHNCNTS